MFVIVVAAVINAVTQSIQWHTFAIATVKRTNTCCKTTNIKRLTQEKSNHHQNIVTSTGLAEGPVQIGG